MKILVTGGSGYIGSAVVRELLSDGAKVKVLARKTEGLRNLEGLDVELAYGDITDFHSIKSALRGCDRVFHLAAIYAIWLPDPKMMHWVNVQGTKNVLEACLQKKIKKVVYTSSVAALGAHGSGRPADESARFNLWHTRDNYYISKFKAERVALACFQRGLVAKPEQDRGIVARAYRELVAAGGDQKRQQTRREERQARLCTATHGQAPRLDTHGWTLSTRPLHMYYPTSCAVCQAAR